MELWASDITIFYRPQPCALRIVLRQQNVPAAEPSEFERILQQLGLRHERQHLATLGPYLDLSDFPSSGSARETAKAISERVPVIYQGELVADAPAIGATVVGRPDFLIADGAGYLIRDAKLSRQVGGKHHPEISLQLQLYGWLFEQTSGIPATRLQVLTGKGEIIEIQHDSHAALAKMREIAGLKGVGAEPYEPVGWSKCGGCGYQERCWQRAEASQDVAIVRDLDQELARALHSRGIKTVPELLASFTADQFANLKRPWGNREQRVGSKSSQILLNAEVLMSGKPLNLSTPAIPSFANYVMFDLEGMPPHLDEFDKIYLWGLQIYGSQPGPFQGVTAGFGPDGDQEGWIGFLRAAKQVFDQHGDVPFVHWHHYERTHLKQYVDRYGDPDGTAARVLRNLLDLLPIAEEAVVLPVPSYSLKVIEQFVGFERTQDEYGGNWAMAQFILATETEDEAERRCRMGDILKYNEEDLAATWAVFEWLMAQGRAAAAIP